MRTTYSVSIMMAAIFMLAFSVSAHAGKMDSRIESSAKKSYVFKTYLKGDDVNVQSKDGAVTLTGSVLEESHKTLAQDTVASLPGVKSVDNKLEIKGETPDKSSDAWLITKVKYTLLFHRSVSATKTEVDAKAGVVTLRGVAANEAQKELTTEYAKDVEGVTDVINDMTVSNAAKKKQTVGEKIDDASITAQVKMTLLNHHSTSALDTKVVTKRGVVTLSGNANNVAEFNLAAKLANDVSGVKSVINHMSVE
ncbi:MAG: BON domain-containing protein [Desulfuromonadaceae bacterium]|nr:BON domain-containing protein [Desulfuromonadaceae bacterium]